jgi:hypothetical protein
MLGLIVVPLFSVEAAVTHFAWRDGQSRFYAIGSQPRLARLFGLNRQTLALAVADE